ncbi:DUF3431 domain-containing protein, partial [bacterium]|nr:DUF3431 domain-containing protein [bacterium]
MLSKHGAIIIIILFAVTIVCFAVWLIANLLTTRSLWKLFKKKSKMIHKNILESPYNVSALSSLYDHHLVLLVSHYSEDLEWLSPLKTPFVITSKHPHPTTIHISPNRGNEASSYLVYIIRYYNSLPEYTLFLHGHQQDWHQLRSISRIVRQWFKNTRKKEYENINSIGVDEHKVGHEMYFKVKRVWFSLFQEELGDLPSVFYDRCCAQFFVHRDRITFRPLSFYQKLLDYIRDERQQDDSMGHVLEVLWHYIFG